MPSGKTRINSNFLLEIFAFLLILSLSVWSVWPVVKSPGNVLVNANDDILITWIINQNIQKIPYELDSIFDGNIFYPYKNTLSFSEHFFPSSIIAYIPVKLTGFPILAYNFNLIFGQIVTITVLYFWFSEITKDKFVSIIAANSLGISQIRIFYFAHLQMWNMHWWLIALWMVWKFRNYSKVKYLYFAAIFSAIQFWESVLPIYFIFFGALFMLYAHRDIIIKNYKHVFGAISIFLILILPLTIGYLRVWQEFNYVRSIRDAAHFSMSVEELWGRFFSPGLFGLALVCALLINRKVFKKIKDFQWVVLLTIFGFVMSLGPVLKWHGETFKILEKVFIPLPYGIFYYIMPGFGSLRTPLRFLWLFALGLSIFSAATLSLYKSKFKKFIQIGCLFIMFLGGTRLDKIYPAPIPSSYPNVYKFISNLEGDAIIELPMYNWGFGEPAKNELWRMLYSLEHKKKLVNGASGFAPPKYEALADILWKEFPSIELENKFREIGVEYVIVHKKEYPPDKLKKIIEWGIPKIIYEDESELVFEI